jgi:hypothetical protein
MADMPPSPRHPGGGRDLRRQARALSSRDPGLRRDDDDRSTGRGVRIGVIDSGAYPGHPHIHAVAGGIAIDREGRPVAGDETTIDRLGHGTAVMAAIQEKAPDAACFAVRVFHDALKTSAAALVAAIDWCVEQRMDIVNMSLGSVNAAHRDRFAEAADRARRAGTLLVAAREANEMPCYPGALDTVLGVGLEWDCPRERWRVEPGPIFYASGYPRPIPGVAPQRNLYGISFAVANMTGFVAQAWESAGNAQDALRALETAA